MLTESINIKVVLRDVVFWRNKDTRNVTDDVYFVDEFTYDIEYLYDDVFVNFDEVRDYAVLEAIHAMNVDQKQWTLKEYKGEVSFSD
jgi:hypothetical protein